MTLKETYTGIYDKTALFQALNFLGFGPDVKVDQQHNTITFSDPSNAKNQLLLETKNLTVQNGEITGGTIAEIHVVINKKDAVSLTGASIDATMLNSATQGDVSGLYTALVGNLNGTLIAKGDKYDNILEVGKGGKATVSAGDGNDLINIWNNKNVVIDGGEGLDTIDFESYMGTITPATGVAKVDLAAGTGTNPFGGTLKIENVENVVNRFNQSADLRGDNHANLFVGGSFADTLMGRGGDDEIHIQINHSVDPRAIRADGGAGKDVLFAELSEAPGAPMTGTGATLRFHNVLDLEKPQDNTGTFHGGTFKNFETFQVIGFLDKDVFEFSGSKANETVLSAGSDDPLNGRGGNDVLNGGGGADLLTGGAGADKFQYQHLSDSTQAIHDTIADFSHAQHDKIDLHLMSPSQNFSGAYDFIGSKKFDGKSSEVRFVHSGQDTIVYVDDNGDKAADMEIVLHHGPAKLVAGDFLL